MMYPGCRGVRNEGQKDPHHVEQWGAPSLRISSQRSTALTDSLHQVCIARLDIKDQEQLQTDLGKT